MLTLMCRVKEITKEVGAQDCTNGAHWLPAGQSELRVGPEGGGVGGARLPQWLNAEDKLRILQDVTITPACIGGSISP